MNPPDFIVIPYLVDQDKSLQPNDKRLYGYLYWLENLKNQRITASNATLAELLGVTDRTIRGALERLEKGGHIVREFEDEGRKKRSVIRTRVKFRVGTDIPTVGTNVPKGRNKRSYSVGINIPQKKKSTKEEKKEEDTTNVVSERKRSKAPIQEVSDLVDYWKAKLDMPSDESARASRFHASTLLKRMRKALAEKGLEQGKAIGLCKAVIDSAMSDPFHGPKSTTMLYIMRHASRIVQENRSKALKQTIVKI